MHSDGSFLIMIIIYLIFLAIGMGITFFIILMAINKSTLNKNISQNNYLLQGIKARLDEIIENKKQ